MSRFAPPPGEALPPGTLLGAFLVLSSIGHGGMGAVYRVRNRITGDERALKVILPEMAANPQFVERFVREIRLAMAVEHPNLVRVFEPGMHDDRMFLPMELLKGETLADRLKRNRWLSVDDAIALLRAVGSALSALHARGILHRDVKPSNVLLAEERDLIVPKLLDLGAGKEVGVSDEATATGQAIGSPHYMAPEQASGQKHIDARADQYALAVVAYQLFTGARPYENDDTGHVLAKVLSGAPYKMPHELRPDIPPGVEEAVLRAMSRSPEARFASIDDFLGALVSRAYEPSSLRAAPVPAVATPNALAHTVAAPDALAHTVAAPDALARTVAAPDALARSVAVEPSGAIPAAVVGSTSTQPSSARIWAGVAAVVAGVAIITSVTVHWLVGRGPTESTATASSESREAAAQASAEVPPPPAPSAVASPEPSPPATEGVSPPPPLVADPVPSAHAALPTARPVRPRAPSPARPVAPGAPSAAAAPCKPTLGAPCL